MSFITITTVTDTDLIDIDFGGLPYRLTEARMRVGTSRSVALLSDDTQVEVVFTNGEIFTFKKELIKDINGVTTFATTKDLYDALKVLM